MKKMPLLNPTATRDDGSGEHVVKRINVESPEVLGNRSKKAKKVSSGYTSEHFIPVMDREIILNMYQPGVEQENEKNLSKSNTSLSAGKGLEHYHKETIIRLPNKIYWTDEEGQKILKAMIRLNDQNDNLTTEFFWTDVINLSVSFLKQRKYSGQFLNVASCCFRGLPRTG